MEYTSKYYFCNVGSMTCVTYNFLYSFNILRSKKNFTTELTKKLNAFSFARKKSGFEVSGFKLTTCFFYGKFLLIGTSIRDGMGQFFSFWFFLYFTWVGLGPGPTLAF